MDLKKKKITLLILAFLGIVVPFHKTHAFVIELAAAFSFHLIAAITQLVLLLSRLCVGAASWVLQWVLSPDFIDWSYTGMDNPIINVGWTLTRDLTNMAFVIVLAFIGLATALKLEQYRYQKLLPQLIFIALIINFSPVICGVVVDASNILTNFFVGQFSGMELFCQQSAAQESLIINAFGGGLGNLFNPFSKIYPTLQALLMTGFNYWAALLFILFAFIFAGRYVAIWILVILSPIAFFASILPNTKGFFKQWWKWFLQWCFIGVTSGFFFYLGNHMLVRAHTMIHAPAPETNVFASILVQFFHFALPYGIALGFLSMGLLLALKGSAVGADKMVTGAKWTGKQALSAAKWTGEKGKQLVREKMPTKTQAALGSLATTKTPFAITEEDRKKTGLGGWATRAGKGIARGVIGAPYATVARKIGGMALPEAELGKIEEEAKEMEKFKTPEALIGEFRRQEGANGSRAGRIAAFKTAKSKEWLDFWGASEDEILQTGREAFAVSPDMAISMSASYPKFAAQMAKGSPETAKKIGLDKAGVIDWVGKNYATFGFENEEKAKKAADTDDNLSHYTNMKATKDFTFSSTKNLEAITPDQLNMDAVHLFGSGREIGTLARKYGEKFVDGFMDGVKIRGENASPKIKKYLGTQGAESLGMFMPDASTSRPNINKIDFPMGAPPERWLRWLKAEISVQESLMGSVPSKDKTKVEEKIRILKREQERLQKQIRPSVPPAAQPSPPSTPGRPPGGGTVTPQTPGRPPGGRTVTPQTPGRPPGGGTVITPP